MKIKFLYIYELSYFSNVMVYELNHRIRKIELHALPYCAQTITWIFHFQNYIIDCQFDNKFYCMPNFTVCAVLLEVRFPVNDVVLEIGKWLDFPCQHESLVIALLTLHEIFILRKKLIFKPLVTTLYGVDNLRYFTASTCIK